MSDRRVAENPADPRRTGSMSRGARFTGDGTSAPAAADHAVGRDYGDDTGVVPGTGVWLNRPGGRRDDGSHTSQRYERDARVHSGQGVGYGRGGYEPARVDDTGVGGTLTGTTYGGASSAASYATGDDSDANYGYATDTSAGHGYGDRSYDDVVAGGGGYPGATSSDMDGGGHGGNGYVVGRATYAGDGRYGAGDGGYGPSNGHGAGRAYEGGYGIGGYGSGSQGGGSQSGGGHGRRPAGDAYGRAEAGVAGNDYGAMDRYVPDDADQASGGDNYVPSGDGYPSGGAPYPAAAGDAGGGSLYGSYRGSGSDKGYRTQGYDGGHGLEGSLWSSGGGQSYGGSRRSWVGGPAGYDQGPHAETINTGYARNVSGDDEDADEGRHSRGRHSDEEYASGRHTVDRGWRTEDDLMRPRTTTNQGRFA